MENNTGIIRETVARNCCVKLLEVIIGPCVNAMRHDDILVSGAKQFGELA